MFIDLYFKSDLNIIFTAWVDCLLRRVSLGYSKLLEVTAGGDFGQTHTYITFVTQQHLRRTSKIYLHMFRGSVPAILFYQYG